MKSFFFKLFLLVALFIASSGDLFAQGTWTHIGNMPEVRLGHTADEINGKIYVAGGVKNEQTPPTYPSDTTMFICDSINGSWTQVSLPNSIYRSMHTSCVVDGNLFLIGGVIPIGGIMNSTAEMWMYNTTTGQWISKPPMPTHRCNLDCVVLNGKIYVMGGMQIINGVPHNNDLLVVMEVYDIASETWSTASNMTSGRWGHRAVAFNGKIYVIGGNLPVYYSSNEVYDPQTNIWTQLSTLMPTGRYQFAACLLNNKIFTIGGWFNSATGPIYDKVEVYDPVAQVWSTETSMPVAIGMPDCFAMNGKIYVFGGSNTTHPLHGISNIYEFSNEGPIPPGTYTIGLNGNFATIQEALNKLSTDGIAGNVTFNLIDNLYTAPTDSFGFKLKGPIPGAGPDSRVTLKPAQNKNVTIQGSGRATLSFLKTRYVTIDGVGITGQTTLTIRSLVEPQFTWVNSMVFFPPAAHNIVENITFNNENYLKGVGLAFMSFVSTTSPLDSNLIQNNFVKKAAIGIYISGWSGIAEARYNTVRGNIIGSETDSLITWGIQIEGNDNTIIENNRIENIKQQFDLNVITHGINIYGGNSCIVRNNVVHKVRSHLLYGSTGILLSGDGTFGYGINNQVYNNMVYDIQSTSIDPSSRVAGIQLWYQHNPKIYYNSVYLSGRGGKNPFGSAALFTTWLGTVTNLDAKNNILVNTRVDTPYCASTIRDYSLTAFTSDYNDLYYEPNQHNCLVRIGDTDYLTLTEWQATGKDLHSITEKPHFILPDLHIYPHMSTLLDSQATPIAGITTDFDNETRSAEKPDIGADEFEVSFIFTQLSVDVDSGWNVVSIPGLHPVNQNVDTWWAYRDQSANVFKYSDGYHNTDYVTPGLGYWMKHEGARTYNTGDEWPGGGIQIVFHDPIAADSGWNLIGGYDLSVTAANVTTNPPGLQNGRIYAYSGGYQVATTIDPGYGYWIKLSGAGQIIIPETLSKSEVAEYFPKDWGRIILTDATGESYILYSVNGEVDRNDYELPPLPPVGIFDIRYASGRIAEDLSNDSQIIQMQGITYPITIKTEGVTITLQDETGKIVNSILNPGKELTINNSSVNRLIIISGEVDENIPTVYSLEQNYPNPFNPSTVISWQSPSDSRQTIKVYDILGNVVTTLIDEYREAGKYQIEFNASELASGIYFYQLTAGDFISVKKMVLMK